MKFIFSFLFGILILSPTFASYECTENTQQGQCNCTGWGWVNLDENSGFCIQCSETQYSPANDSVCHDCIDSGGNWAEGPTRPMHSIFDTNHATAGQPSCPWVCDNGYYKSGNSCEQCPTGSAPGIGNNSIEECCYNDTITKYLITNSSHDTYRCASINNPETKYDATNRTFYCVTGAVPSYSNGFLTACHCNSSGHAVYNPTTEICECDPTSQYPTPSTDNDGVVSCSACPANAFNDNGTCKCNVNYYGNGLTCTQCPAGTTKSAGGDEDHPTTQSACHFTSGATKFCVPSNVRTATNDGYVCFTPTNVTYTY